MATGPQAPRGRDRREAKEAIATIVSDVSMAEPVVVALGGGRAALFSTRAPYKAEAEASNEDAAGVFALAPETGVLAVADGLGGLPGAASAARLALVELEARLTKTAPDAEDSLRAPILDAFEAANEAVLGLGIGAATTLAVAELRGDRLRTYHVGDSAILVTGQRGKLKLQTMAHSPTGYGVEAGLLDEEEALHHEERYLVSNALGSNDMRIEVGSAIRLAARDTVLLASDGLFDNLSASEIVDHVRAGPIEAAAAALVEHASARMAGAGATDLPSKPDDLSFVLFRPS